MGDNRPAPRKDGVSANVSEFLEKASALTPRARPSGGDRARLAVILDATASREHAWDAAVQIQAEMFETAAALGGLDVELIFSEVAGQQGLDSRNRFSLWQFR